MVFIWVVSVQSGLLLAGFSIYRLGCAWQLIRVQCETNLRFKVRGKFLGARGVVFGVALPAEN